jgi:nitrogen fixation/metabolism regulation signal transduction histidine kinase
MNRTPTTFSLFFVLSLVAAIFVLGMITVVLLRRFTNRQAPSLPRLQAYLSIFFTLVAVTVTVDLFTLTYQFNHYVNTTLHRDLAQEDCQRATLKALRAWAIARKDVYDAEHERDQALAVMFDEIERGEYAHPDTATKVADTFADVEAARQRAGKSFADNPIPDCKLGPV